MTLNFYKKSIEVNINGNTEFFKLQDNLNFDDRIGRYFFGGSSANVGSSAILSRAIIHRNKFAKQDELSENLGESIFIAEIKKSEEKRRLLNRLVVHSKSKYPSKNTSPRLFSKTKKGTSPKEFTSYIVRKTVSSCWNHKNIMSRISCLDRELERNFLRRFKHTKFESFDQIRSIKRVFGSFSGLQCDGTLMNIFLKDLHAKNNAKLFPYLMAAAERNCALAFLVLAKIHETKGDLSAASMYYSQAAEKAIRKRKLSPEEMVFVDDIRLDDEEALELFEGESGGGKAKSL